MKTNETVSLLVSGLRLGLDEGEDALLSAASAVLRRAGISARPIACRMHKRSIDARRRGGGEIALVCTAMVERPACRIPDAARLKACGISAAGCAPMHATKARLRW